MHKLFAAVVLAGAMLVACSRSGAGDSTRIGPDAAPGDGRHGRRDAGPPDDGPLPSDCGSLPPDDGPLPPDDGPLPPDDGPLPPDDGPLPPDDGRLPPDDGAIPSDGPRHRDARSP